MWSSRWDENWQEKTCPSATFSTTNPTLPDLGSNPATNRLSYGTDIGIMQHILKFSKAISSDRYDANI
jgi:hypothetical protein